MKALVLKSLLVISVVAVTAMAWALTSDPCSVQNPDGKTLCGPDEKYLGKGLNKVPANAEGSFNIVCRQCEEAKQQQQASLTNSTNGTVPGAPSNATSAPVPGYR